MNNKSFFKACIFYLSQICRYSETIYYENLKTFFNKIQGFPLILIEFCKLKYFCLY